VDRRECQPAGTGEAPEGALALVERAMRLSPRDPRSGIWLHHAAWCHWKAGDLERMEHAARRSVEMYRLYGWGWVALACALGFQGRAAAARAAAGVAREVLPGLSLGRFYRMARLFYRRRFVGEMRDGYRRLRAVHEEAMR
jgi:hypothetical protein